MHSNTKSQKQSYYGKEFLSIPNTMVRSSRKATPPHMPRTMGRLERFIQRYSNARRNSQSRIPGRNSRCLCSRTWKNRRCWWVRTYPFWNQYWEDRRARCDKIDIPMYVVASWANALNTRGTFPGFVESPSKEKWLIVHNSHEWPGKKYRWLYQSLETDSDFRFLLPTECRRPQEVLWSLHGRCLEWLGIYSGGQAFHSQSWRQRYRESARSRFSTTKTCFSKAVPRCR